MVINFTNVTSIFGLYFCNGLFHYYHSNHYIVIYVDVDILLPVANGTKTEKKSIIFTETVYKVIFYELNFTYINLHLKCLIINQIESILLIVISKMFKQTHMPYFLNKKIEYKK